MRIAPSLKSCLAAVLCWTLAPLAPAHPQPDAPLVEILSAGLAESGDGIDLELRATGRLSWSAGYQGPGRFVVTLPGAVPGPELRPLSARGRLLAGVEFELDESGDRPSTKAVVRTRGPVANAIVAGLRVLTIRLRPAPALAPRSEAAEPGWSVAASPCLNLRVGADVDEAAIACLPTGTGVEVLEQRGDWRRVRLANGRSGWVSGRFLSRDEARDEAPGEPAFETAGPVGGAEPPAPAPIAVTPPPNLPASGPAPPAAAEPAAESEFESEVEPEAMPEALPEPGMPAATPPTTPDDEDRDEPGDDLAAGLAVSESARRALESRVERLQATLDERQAELAIERDRLTAAGRQLEELRQTVETRELQERRRIQEGAAERRRLAERLQALGAERDELAVRVAAAAELGSALAAATARAERAEAAMVELEARHGQLESRHQDLAQERAAAERQAAELREEIEAELGARIDELLAARAADAERIGALERERERLAGLVAASAVDAERIEALESERERLAGLVAASAVEDRRRQQALAAASDLEAALEEARGELAGCRASERLCRERLVAAERSAAAGASGAAGTAAATEPEIVATGTVPRRPLAAAAPAADLPAEPPMSVPRRPLAEMAAMPEPEAPAPEVATPEVPAPATTGLVAEGVTEEGVARQEVADEGAAPEPVDPAEVVRARVASWAAAWSGQEVDAYLSHYAPSFEPPGGDRAAWEELRRRRLTTPQFIRVELSEVEIERPEVDRALATFTQRYTSNTFADQVRKRLELVRRGGLWKIAEETVLE